MIDNLQKNFSHEATQPAVLLLLKDGIVQSAVLYGSTNTMVYLREEGRGGFGVLPTQTATDFLAFDDLLTREPDQHAALEAPDRTGRDAGFRFNGRAVVIDSQKPL